MQSCNKNNGAADSGAQNACFASSGDLSFSCDKYQPIVVNSSLSYGFAGHGNTATSTCCKCYQFTWTSGAAAGKSMIVQAINAGGITDTDFDIYVSAEVVSGQLTKGLSSSFNHLRLQAGV